MKSSLRAEPDTKEYTRLTKFLLLERQTPDVFSCTSIIYITRDIKEWERDEIAMSTSLSSSSPSSSLSSTRSFTGKSPLRGPRTLETVSQYSFHIVNATATGLRTSARLFTGDLIPPSCHHRSLRRFLLPKDGYYLRETKAPSFVRSPTSPFISTRSILDNTLSSSFSQLHPSFRLPPIFTHLLRHRRSNAAHKFAAKLAKLPVELARICAGEMLL